MTFKKIPPITINQAQVLFREFSHEKQKQFVKDMFRRIEDLNPKDKQLAFAKLSSLLENN